MIDISKLPAVRAQLERDVATASAPAQGGNSAAPAQFARAPESAQQAATRPTAAQRTDR